MNYLLNELQYLINRLYTIYLKPSVSLFWVQIETNADRSKNSGFNTFRLGKLMKSSNFYQYGIVWFLWMEV